MTRRNYITLGLIILVIFLGIGLYIVLTTNKAAPIGDAIRNVLPFGKGGEGGPLKNNGETSTTTPLEFGGELPVLFKLSSEPVAGYSSLIKNGFETVRYVERATGHIIDVNPTNLQRTKIVNSTVQKIYEAYFNNDASKVVYRNLPNDADTVNSVSLTLIPPKATSTTDLFTTNPVRLRENLLEMAVGSSSIFYIPGDTPGVFMSDFEGNKPVTLMQSAIVGWKLRLAGTNILIHTKADSSLSGYAYILNTKNNSLKKILGPAKGLVAVPSFDGNYVAYSYEDSGNHFYVRNLKSGLTTEVLPSTIADKCVWSKKTDEIFCGAPDLVGRSEPESWYLGLSHYIDKIWRFDSENSYTLLLADPEKDFGVDIDLIAPQLSIDEDYLLFINKNDYSLWALRLK